MVQNSRTEPNGTKSGLGRLSGSGQTMICAWSSGDRVRSRPSTGEMAGGGTPEQWHVGARRKSEKIDGRMAITPAVKTT